MSDVANPELLTERLDRLEQTCRHLGRQNRWLKAWAIVVPLVSVIAGAASQGRDITAKTITAERLVINDGQGRKRAAVECREKRASFEMYDPSGARRISLTVNDASNASMYQHYGDGKPSFGWVTLGRDHQSIASFMLRGPNGLAYASLMGKTADSPPIFQVWSGDREPNAVVGKLGGTAQ